MVECENRVDFEKRLTELEQRAKSNTKRIDEVYQRQEENLKLAVRMESLFETVAEIKEDVKSIKEKPAKRWEGMVEKLIWLVAGSAVAALLMQGGIHLG